MAGKGGSGQGSHSRSLEDLSRASNGHTPPGLGLGPGLTVTLSPLTSSTPSPSISPSQSLSSFGLGRTADAPSHPAGAGGGGVTGIGNGASSGGSSGGSGGGFMFGSRQARLTRKNLVDQLRDYQKRHRNDWSAAAFFSATSGIGGESRRRSWLGLGRSTSASSLGGSFSFTGGGGILGRTNPPGPGGWVYRAWSRSPWLSFCALLLLLCLGLHYYLHWSTFSLVALCLGALSLRGAAQLNWSTRRRTFGAVLPV